MVTGRCVRLARPRGCRELHGPPDSEEEPQRLRRGPRFLVRACGCPRLSACRRLGVGRDADRKAGQPPTRPCPTFHRQVPAPG